MQVHQPIFLIHVLHYLSLEITLFLSSLTVPIQCIHLSHLIVHEKSRQQVVLLNRSLPLSIRCNDATVAAVAVAGALLQFQVRLVVCPSVFEALLCTFRHSNPYRTNSLILKKVINQSVILIWLSRQPWITFKSFWKNQWSPTNKKHVSSQSYRIYQIPKNRQIKIMGGFEDSFSILSRSIPRYKFYSN